MKIQGLPGEFLFLFTLLIWVLFILTIISNPHNKLNRWCFISGMLFSVGVFKEYLYFTLAPFLSERFPALITEQFALNIYSIMTAILYYLSMPCVLIFSFYFFGLDRKNPSLFRGLFIAVFIPAAVYAIVFPYIHTRDYQLNNFGYYVSVAVYNWIYGIIATVLIVTPLLKQRLTFQYRQKKMVAITALFPIWYWLISAFLFHIIKIPHYSKMWQGNIVVIIGLLIFNVRNMFKEGIWGTRLTRETYDWFDSSKIIQKNAQYLSHTLKNELSKISWCTDIIRGSSPEHTNELDIIDHSIDHLKQFINRTKLYSDDILLKSEDINVAQIFQSCAKDYAGFKNSKKISITWTAADTPLVCDPEHLKEVLDNLLNNAIDAMKESGEIRLTYEVLPKKHSALIEVADNGCGMDSDVLPRIFDPYFTQKSSFNHLGLGLYYCYNVLDRLDGCIKVKSTPGGGTVFSLYFPMKTTKKEARHE